MSLFDKIFGKKKKSASIAKDRLTIMLAHERANCKLPYMDSMRNEIIDVIKKYTKVEDVKISSKDRDNINVLEVEIILGK